MISSDTSSTDLDTMILLSCARCLVGVTLAHLFNDSSDGMAAVGLRKCGDY